MAEHVLVIHGIATRDESKFIATVDQLNRAVGDDFRLVPVYWGDLGASGHHLDKLMGRYGDRSANMWQMMADSVARPVTSGLGRTLSWITRRRGDREAAERIRALSKQQGLAMDRRVRGYLNDKFQSARLWLTAAILPFIADVIVYQSGDCRQKIHQRVREVMARELPGPVGMAARPVKVIAHSLGGIISFDMAMGQDDPLHIDHLVTLGSQPAFFHVLDPRPGGLGGLEPYDGEPVTLKPTIGRWTNIWDEFDILAFGASEVFRMHDGSVPTEKSVKCFLTALEGAVLLQSHLGYFDKKPAIKAIGEALLA